MRAGQRREDQRALAAGGRNRDVQRCHGIVAANEIGLGEFYHHNDEAEHHRLECRVREGKIRRIFKD